MGKFGLQSIKILALVTAGVLFMFAVGLMVNSAINKAIWTDSASALGSRYTRGFDFCLGVAAVTVAIVIFGWMAIMCNGYGMLVVYLILLCVLTIVTIIGLIAFLIAPWTSNVQRLKSAIENLSPEQLNPLQRRFHCCGVEKYTDYFMIWKVWTGVENPNRTMIDRISTPQYHNPALLPVPEIPSWGRKRSVEDDRPVDLRDLDRKKHSWRKHSFRKLPQEESQEQLPKQVRAFAPKRRDFEVINMTEREGFRYTKPRKKHGRKWRRPGLLSRAFRWVVNKLGELIGLVPGPVQKLAYKLWGSAANIYEGLIPKIIKDVLRGLFGYIWSWIDWMASPFKSHYKWWYGSGWDGIPMKYIYPDLGPMLPYTCCKNPTFPCRGNEDTTWMEGCVYAVGVQWQIDTNLLVSGIVAYGFCSVINIAVIVILIGGIREQYYF